MISKLISMNASSVGVVYKEASYMSDFYMLMIVVRLSNFSLVLSLSLLRFVVHFRGIRVH